MIPNVLSSASQYLSGLWLDNDTLRRHAVIQKFSAYIDADDAGAIKDLLAEGQTRADLVAALQEAAYSPLHCAAEQRKDKALQVCIDTLPFGVWALRTRDSERTPLMLAMSQGHDTLVSLLKGRLIEWLDALDKLPLDQAQDGLDDLKIAFDCDFEKDDALVTVWQMLVNARDADGNTALLLALKSRQFTCCRELLFRHADVDIQNEDGQSARYLALDLPANEDIRSLLYRALPACDYGRQRS